MTIARRSVGTVEIVTVDSMQVYRGMDIGTAKPSLAERAEVPHHVIDLVDPTEEFSVARFQRSVRAAVAGIDARGKQALLVGGTGLYVRAIVDDLDIPGEWPEIRNQLEHEAAVDPVALHHRLAALDATAAARMEPTNARRIVRALEVTLGSGRPFSSFGPGLDRYPPTPRFRQVGLRADRDVLTARIGQRFHAMVAAGLVDEVRALLHRHPGGLSRTARQALGYREVLCHVEEGVPLEQAVDEAIQRTRTFAVRQERWFRRDPRVRWHDVTVNNVLAVADAVLGDWKAA